MPVRFKGNMAVNTLRGPSGAIWSNCPWAPGAGQPGSIDGQNGKAFYDDFQMIGNATMTSAVAGSIGQWSVYGYAGAQLNDAAIEGGGIKIGSNDDQEGLAMISSAGSYRFVTTSTLALNRRMWFEARVARSSVTTVTGDCFVGLASPALTSGLPIAAYPISVTDDTLSTVGNLFGFHSNSTAATRGGPTEWAVAFVLPSGTVNYPTNLTTLVASTGNTALGAGDYVKLGWFFDPRPNQKRIVTSATARQTAGDALAPLIRFFVNGLEAGAFLASADVANATATQAFPTGFMGPAIAEMNTAGSSPLTLNVDWIACFQEGLS